MRVKRGFCSIFVMLIVMFTSLLGTFLLILAEREFFTAEDFASGLVAENLAYAGVCDIMVKLAREGIVFDEKLKFVAESPPEYAYGKYRAYLDYQDGIPIVFSVGEYKAAKRQLVAQLQLSDRQKFSIMYLNKK